MHILCIHFFILLVCLLLISVCKMPLKSVDTTLTLNTPSSDLHASKPNTSNANTIRNKKKKFKPTSSPMFISSEMFNKFPRNKLQPGCLISVSKDSELYAMFAHASWTAMLSHPSRKVLPNLVAEFYGNMGVGKGVNDVLYLTSVINGCPILVDHLLLGRILKINSHAMSMSPIDVGTSFIFNGDEQKLFLTIFCGMEWHQDALVTDKKVSYEHFRDGDGSGSVPDSDALMVSVINNPAYNQVVILNA